MKSPASAEGTITTAALVVGIIYAYRYLVEGPSSAATKTASKPAAKQLLGAGGVPPLSHWIPAYGFAFLVISMIGQIAPGAGAGLATLTAVGTVLSQGQQLSQDINASLGDTGTSAGGLNVNTKAPSTLTANQIVDSADKTRNQGAPAAAVGAAGTITDTVTALQGL